MLATELLIILTWRIFLITSMWGEKKTCSHRLKPAWKK